jgi:hypothetical protein
MEVEATEHFVYKDRIDKAIRLSYGVVKSMHTTPVDFSLDGMFIVWHCKPLQNWKAILSATFPGAPLVEVTYNGDKKETYIDVYKKLENVRIPD